MASDAVSEELRAAERDIDLYHKTNPLTRRTFAQAGWYFLAICEEISIMDIIRHDAQTNQEHAAIADNLIVHATWPLRWLSRACAPGTLIPRSFDEEMYQAAWDLSNLSMEYASFESAFTYATLGLVSLTLDGNRIKTSGPMRSDTRFDAYDRLTHSPDRLPTEPTGQTFLQRVSTSVRVRGDWFDYDLNPRVVRDGIEELGPLMDGGFVLPDDWILPRYTLDQFRKIVRILRILAMVHFHARTTAAMQGCRGLGSSRALILMDTREIIRRLRRYSGIAEANVSAIIEDLTYASRGQINPDPALQPIVPLSSSVVAISPSLLISSSMERNLAVLLNRLPTERQAYSALSQDRETRSNERLVGQLSGLGFRFWRGDISEWEGASEIDFAIVSDAEQQCLILELKSFVGPAEPREIRDRSEEISRGIEQIRDRIKMANTSPAPLRALLKIDSRYRLTWAVASETSVGAAYVQAPDVPVINTGHLISKLQRGQGLTACCAWLENREYLPIEGIHYRAAEIVARVGRWALEWYQLVDLVDGYV